MPGAQSKYSPRGRHARSQRGGSGEGRSASGGNDLPWEFKKSLKSYKGKGKKLAIDLELATRTFRGDKNPFSVLRPSPGDGEELDYEDDDVPGDGAMVT